MASMLRIRNFEKFQHYGQNRTPPWIKLHRSVLTDYEFRKLPDHAKAHLMLLWLVASGCNNALHDDAEWLQSVTGSRTPIEVEILLSAGFIERYSEGARKHRASKALAERKQDARLDKTRLDKTRLEENGAVRVNRDANTEEATGLLADTPPPPDPTPRRTWLTEPGEAWEREYGPGSFDYGTAARELAPIRKAGLEPETIARRLAFYLAQKGSETVLPPDQLARRHFTPSLRDFRQRHAKFDPDALEAA